MSLILHFLLLSPEVFNNDVIDRVLRQATGQIPFTSFSNHYSLPSNHWALNILRR